MMHRIRHSDLVYTFCGILMLVSEIWKQWTLTFLLNDGTYIWWYFPFQLCSIPMYVCLAMALVGNPTVQQHFPALRRSAGHIQSLLPAFLMDFGLLGGIFAFFDTSGMHYGYLPLTIHSFAWHFLLIFLGCYSGTDKKADHSLRGFRFSSILYLVCCAIATIWNLAFYRFGIINMFYISPHYYMHQKVFSHITDTFGNSWGITSYILASIVGAGLLHLLWRWIIGKLPRSGK